MSSHSTLHSTLQFRPYLYGKPFTLVTDHKALVWMKNKKDPSARVTRWRLKHAEYEFNVVHRPGKSIAHVDALSRNPPELPETTSKIQTKSIFITTRAQSGAKINNNKLLKALHDIRPKKKRKQKSPPLTSEEELEEDILSPNFDDIITREINGTQALEEDILPFQGQGANTSELQAFREHESFKCFGYTRESIRMRKDHLMYFLTTNGEAIDDGAIELQTLNRILKTPDLKIAQPIAFPVNKKVH